jgi:hypothetical protein
MGLLCGIAPAIMCGLKKGKTIWGKTIEPKKEKSKVDLGAMKAA